MERYKLMKLFTVGVIGQKHSKLGKEVIQLAYIPAKSITFNVETNNYALNIYEKKASSASIVLIPHQHLVYSEYLFYYLQTKKLPLTAILQHELLLPDFAVQQKVMSILIKGNGLMEQLHKLQCALQAMEAYEEVAHINYQLQQIQHYYDKQLPHFFS